MRFFALARKGFRRSYENHPGATDARWRTTSFHPAGSRKARRGNVTAGPRRQLVNYAIGNQNPYIL